MVKINGVIKSIENNSIVNFDGTEEYHFGSLVLQNTTQREPYPDWSDIVFTINGVDREFTLQRDISTRNSIGRYKHDITFVEPVIKLSQYYHPDRLFDTRDGSKVTYLYQLQQLIKDVSFGKSTVFTIATATQTLLNQEAVRKEYVGGNFLISVFDLFRAVDAVPTLTLDNEIGHRSMNDLNNLVSFDTPISEVITSDISDYGSAVYAKIKGAVYDLDTDISGVYIPKEGAGITPRSSVPKYTDANAEWHLNDGVRQAYRVRIMNLGTVSYGTITADITDWVVMQDDWGDLEEERNFTTMLSGIYANNTLYITPDGKVKNAGVTYESTTVPDYIAMRYLIESYLFNAYGVTTEYVAQNLEDYELEFYIQSLRDIDAEVQRHYSSKVTKRSLITSNQQDSELELGRHGNSLKQFINRIGNDTYDITFRYRSGDTIPYLDDYTVDGYKILKITYNIRESLSPESYDVTFHLVKNASIINPLTSVNNAVSPFTIQGKSVLSNFVYNEYVELGATNRTNTSNVSDLGRRAMFNALLWSSPNNVPIRISQYTSPDTDTTSAYLNLSAEAVPLGTNILCNAQFRNKKRAGYQLSADTGFSNKLVPVNYANENGQVDQAKFTFINTTVTNPDNHPVGSFTTPIIDGNNNDVNLNPNEILGHTTMEHFITDRENFIIGDYLAQNNSLVKSITSAPSVTIKEYDATVKHTVLDKVAKSGSTGTGSYTVEANYNYIDVSVTSGKSWVMCDTTSGKIYMAFNYIDADMTRIYINTLTDNPHETTL